MIITPEYQLRPAASVSEKPQFPGSCTAISGARYYEPTSGRFLSPDPMGHAASMSLYDYANGDPVNGFDPDGRIFWTGLSTGEFFGAASSGLWQGGKTVTYSAVTAPYRMGQTVVSGYQQIGGLIGDGLTGNSGVIDMASHPINTLKASGSVAVDTAIGIGHGIVQQAQTSEGLANLSTDLAMGLGFGELAAGARIPTQRPTIANYIDQGFTPAQAEYLTQPYSGMGEHFVKRALLDERGLNLPDDIINSQYNVLSGDGMTIGEFYQRHFQVDSDFYGARFPNSIGGGWSGSELGLEEFGLFNKLWYGTPEDLMSLITSQAAFWSTHRSCPQ